MACGTPPLSRPSPPLAEVGAGGRGLPQGGRPSCARLKRRAAWRHRQCGWHLWFALSLRVRRLSARIPGPASPVEACHPRKHGETCPLCQAIIPQTGAHLVPMGYANVVLLVRAPSTLALHPLPRPKGALCARLAGRRRRGGGGEGRKLLRRQLARTAALC